MKKSNVFAFSLGAGLGSVVTYFMTKSNFEKKCNEEIESVKNAYKKFDSEVDEGNSSEEIVESNTVKKSVTVEKPDIMEYAEKLKDEGYVNEGIEIDDPKFMEDPDDEDRFEIIDAETYGEDNFEAEHLSFYEDGILAYDFGPTPVIEVPEEIIGDSLKDFDDDIMYVRDHKLRIDYEIIKDEEQYFPD